MRWKQADFLAGLFVLAGFALIISIIAVVRGQIGTPDRYHTYFSNVAGLRAGAAVVYEGYIIGDVAEVTPEADAAGMRFRIDLDVEQGWVIPADSLAEISAVSLLSANAIQISAGSAAPLPPGSEIDSITAVNVMAEISKTADELTDIAQTHVAPLLGTLRDVLDNEGRGALSSVSASNVARIDAILTRLDSAAVELEKTMQAASRATKRMEQTISDENIEAIDSILVEMQSLQKEVGAIVSTSVGTSENLRSISEAGEDRMNSLLQRLEAAAINGEEMTARLRDDPSLIIRGSE